MEFYSGCKPKMEDHDIHVRADVTGYNVVIGSQLNVEDMTKNRHFLRYRNLVSIKVRTNEQTKDYTATVPTTTQCSPVADQHCVCHDSMRGGQAW